MDYSLFVVMGRFERPIEGDPKTIRGIEFLPSHSGCASVLATGWAETATCVVTVRPVAWVDTGPVRPVSRQWPSISGGSA